MPEITPGTASILKLLDVVQYELAPYLYPRGANCWIDTSLGRIVVGFTAWEDRAAHWAWLNDRIRQTLHRDALDRVTVKDYSDYRPETNELRRAPVLEATGRDAGNQCAPRKPAQVRTPSHVHAK